MINDVESDSNIKEAFEQFSKRLEVTSVDERVINELQQKVHNCLGQKFQIIDTFISGAYKSGTMPKPFDGVDLFVVLSPTHGKDYFFEIPPQKIITEFKNTLMFGNIGAMMKDIDRAVNVKSGGYSLDVIPAFSRKGGGVLMPDIGKTKWVRTNPKAHNEKFLSVDRNSGNKLSTVAKMVKCWNNINGKLLHSFHIDVLIMKNVSTQLMDNYPRAILDFFSTTEKMISAPCYDPVDPVIRIDDYLNESQRMQLKMKLNVTAENVLKAINLEKSSYGRQAMVIWKILFGTLFSA